MRALPRHALGRSQSRPQQRDCASHSEASPAALSRCPPPNSRNVPIDQPPDESGGEIDEEREERLVEAKADAGSALRSFLLERKSTFYVFSNGELEKTSEDTSY